VRKVSRTPPRSLEGKKSESHKTCQREVEGREKVKRKGGLMGVSIALGLASRENWGEEWRMGLRKGPRWSEKGPFFFPLNKGRQAKGEGNKVHPKVFIQSKEGVGFGKPIVGKRKTTLLAPPQMEYGPRPRNPTFTKTIRHPGGGGWGG